jgi:hypothetical protein
VGLLQARGNKPKFTDNEEVGKVATIERERRDSLLCEVRNGESKWSHRAQTDLVKRKQHATLVFTFITNLLERSASHRTNRCIVTASDSRGDKRKDSVCFKVRHASFSLLALVISNNDATCYISMYNQSSYKKVTDSWNSSDEWV